jgi:hypothetical protein
MIVLDDLARVARIELQLELYEGQPALHHRVILTNQQVKAEYVNAADLAPYSFATDAHRYTIFHVAQWSVAPQPEDFQTGASALRSQRTPVSCSPVQPGNIAPALRDETGRGLLAGWEFDG